MTNSRATLRLPVSLTHTRARRVLGVAAGGFVRLTLALGSLWPNLSHATATSRELTTTATVLAVSGAETVLLKAERRRFRADSSRTDQVRTDQARTERIKGLPAGLRHRVRVETLRFEGLRSKFRSLVLLPSTPLEPGRKYPLLVLLHAHGSPPVAWLRSGKLHVALDRLVAEGKMPPCIVLLAAGGFGYWVNWKDGRHPYGDLVVQGYLARMRANYPVAEGPERVAIAGASMGGFGALSLGLRHPERFGFVGALSPTDFAMAIAQTPKRAMYRRVLGPDDTMVACINPNALVTAGCGRSQRLALAWGQREGSKFRAGSQRLARNLARTGVQHATMEVANGKHSWRATWRQALPFMLEQLGQAWRSAPAVLVGALQHVE